MIINCASNMKSLGRVAEKLLNANPKAGDLLRDATLSIGLSSDPAFGVPANAMRNPLFVGDSAMLGNLNGLTPQLDAMYKKNKASLDMKPTYNAATGKYDMVVSKAAPFTGDSGSLIAMQTISPWNASFFPEIYRQPLLYSHARDLVKRKSGTQPWGETQALQLAAYSGWGQIDDAGTAAANLKKNVNVQSGMMVNAVINLKIYFNFTVEEMQRAEGGNGSPFAGSLMAEKQRYAQYVLDMMTDYLTYYGNTQTDTPGLFDINAIETWVTTGRDSLSTIAASNSTTKGSDMYRVLSKAINDFMGASYNKFDIVRVAMAPAAYNLLASTPYSDAYNPKATLSVFAENFEGGVTKSGSKPRIEFFSDPLLAANTEFNPTGSDKLVITAPEVGAGPNDDKQDILLLGVPLENFVYPVYPNSYDQQHCVLRRFAGVFAPVSKAVKVYSGFGVSA